MDDGRETGLKIIKFSLSFYLFVLDGNKVQSGAPVINGETKSLIAIGSNSRPCAVGFPNMFLKVGQYKNWIEATMNT